MCRTDGDQQLLTYLVILNPDKYHLFYLSPLQKVILGLCGCPTTHQKRYTLGRRDPTEWRECTQCRLHTVIG